MKSRVAAREGTALGQIFAIAATLDVFEKLLISVAHAYKSPTFTE